MVKNISNICLFGPSNCSDCSLFESLKCDVSLKDRILFIFPIFFSFLIAFLGLFINGLFTELLVFLGLFFIVWVTFFAFWEIYVLCRHCPFYAEDADFLHCFGNYLSPKFWKYSPRPMNNWEKIQLFIIFGIMLLIVLYPVYLLFTVGAYLFGFLVIVGVLSFIFVLQVYFCPRCPNFSCPFNRVSRETIEKFLDKNPEMKKIWKDYGY